MVVKRSERYDKKFTDDELKKNNEHLVLDLNLLFVRRQHLFGKLSTRFNTFLIQTRLYVVEYGGSFRMVMGEVFELSTNNSDPLLELRIEPKTFDIKLEMRYINEVLCEMPLFKDLAVFATQ
uniref:Mediator of RNA polymerase II transcription subunit 20 n=1 Tax=Meloidogyne hapla TaxID=6305 RepID=A0A1I8BZR1_MELHA